MLQNIPTNYHEPYWILHQLSFFHFKRSFPYCLIMHYLFDPSITPTAPSNLSHNQSIYALIFHLSLLPIDSLPYSLNTFVYFILKTWPYHLSTLSFTFSSRFLPHYSLLYPYFHSKEPKHTLSILNFLLVPKYLHSFLSQLFDIWHLHYVPLSKNNFSLFFLTSSWFTLSFFAFPAIRCVITGFIPAQVVSPVMIVS